MTQSQLFPRQSVPANDQYESDDVAAVCATAGIFVRTLTGNRPLPYWRFEQDNDEHLWAVWHLRPARDPSAGVLVPDVCLEHYIAHLVASGCENYTIPDIGYHAILSPTHLSHALAEAAGEGVAMAMVTWGSDRVAGLMHPVTFVNDIRNWLSDASAATQKAS